MRFNLFYVALNYLATLSDGITMNKYWSSLVAQLEPYTPGEQPKEEGLIKLNTNENPYPPAPSVQHALAHTDTKALRLYPDPSSETLSQTIAQYYHVKREQVFVGNGSDEVLAHCFQALLKQSSAILMPDISYSFYPVYCGVIFPNPNAPTGMALPLVDIESLLQRNTESVVVVDEAYVDFGAESAVSLIDKYKNLLVIKTLSKSRSLAGLRGGYAMGDTGLIAALERVKNSFNSYPLDRYAQIGATESFLDELYFQRTRQKIIDTRASLSQRLAALGFDVLPSQANFVFAKHSTHSAAQLQQSLRSKNIIVRYFNKPRISEYLRITVGTVAECDALITALEDILG